MVDGVYFFDWRSFSWHSIEQKPVFPLNFLASLLWFLGGWPQTLHFIFQPLAARIRMKDAYLRSHFSRHVDFLVLKPPNRIRAGNVVGNINPTSGEKLMQYDKKGI